MAAIIAVTANIEGKSEIVGLHVGPLKAEIFWSTFLKSMVRRGLRGVKLVISDAHEGLKAAIRRVGGASWQRCRVHWMRNALSYVPRGQQSMVSAALRQAFIQPDRASASQTLRHVADQLRAKWPKLSTFINESEADMLAHLDFSRPASDQDPQHQPAGTPEQGGQAASRCRRHLPQRGRDHPPDRRRPAGGKRRVAASTPIHADRGDGRTYTAVDRHPAHPDFHRSRLIPGRLSSNPISTTLTDVIASDVSAAISEISGIGYVR